MDAIDLRSDTVTWPTPAMRQAMADAEVGDDTWRDDPTVVKLEELAAERLKKEAALFVPSGTMGNLAAALAHCDRGDELILGDKSHTFRWEAGGIAVVGGIHPHLLPNQDDGTLDIEDIRTAIRADDPHFPRSRAIFLENTHNNCGGIAIPTLYFKKIRALVDKHQLKFHLDGARVFNAAAALKVPVTEITQYADSVMFCLSKGLCAPIGSMVCGPKEFIYHVRRARKMLGGGMRQVGVLAAAGIIALKDMVDRLEEDHYHAKQLAEGLAALPTIEIDMDTIQTNIVFFNLKESAQLQPLELVERMEKEFNVKIGLVSGREFRIVTHYWITGEDVKTTITGFQSLL